MRIRALKIRNLGPFDFAEVDLRFGSETDSEPAPVALITGENGTGKSVLIDALRWLFGPRWAKVERRLTRAGHDFFVELSYFDRGHGTLYAMGFDEDGELALNEGWLRAIPESVAAGRCPPWVVDFWRGTLATDDYEIQGLTKQRHDQFLEGALQGTYRNAAVTELLCSFDYLRDSRDPREKRTGEVLYETASRIIRASLLDGELSHVERSTFTPMVRQAGQLVPLANISSGNAYLVHHLIGLLGKMYAVQQLLGLDPEELTKTPGLLLIEEPENHLHPKWQKKVLPSILEVFPNLQIIATTHSPFVLSSIPHARVFACRFDGKACVVDDVTTDYVDQPAEEILLSEAFDTTTPFGLHMTELLQKRKAAIAAGDSKARADAEAELKRRNPRHFAYLDIDAKLEALTAKKSA